MKKSIFDNNEYFRIFLYILMKNKARSYEITKKFGIYREKGLKKNRQNMSKKLQTLKKKGLIKVNKIGSRGRHGRYSEYIVNKKGIYKYFIKRYNILYLSWYTKEDFIEDFQNRIIEGLVAIGSSYYVLTFESPEFDLIRDESIKKIYGSTLNVFFGELSSYLLFEGLSKYVPKSNKLIQKLELRNKEIIKELNKSPEIELSEELKKEYLDN